jgi:hypothetical protein
VRLAAVRLGGCAAGRLCGWAAAAGRLCGRSVGRSVGQKYLQLCCKHAQATTNGGFCHFGSPCLFGSLPFWHLPFWHCHFGTCHFGTCHFGSLPFWQSRFFGILTRFYAKKIKNFRIFPYGKTILI